MKYNDEVEDQNDIGSLICFLLTKTNHDDELWDFFDEVLGEDSIDGLENTCKHWKEEQDET